MKNFPTIFVISCALIIALTCASWWAFGWSTSNNPELGVIKEYRWFGRITRVTSDVNQDGTIDGELIARWSEPFEGNGGIASFRSMSEDRNFDGRWDTWILSTDDSPTSTLVSGDTNGDGSPDWKRPLKYGEYAEAIEELRAIRGF